MSRATERYHNPNLAEQPSLLSQEVLAELQCPSASQPLKVETVPCKACRQDTGEHFLQRAAAIQSKLPGF